MTVLTKKNIKNVYHFSPIHYLPFICKTKNLLSKDQLKKIGFSETHFRSTSFGQDKKRGFSKYVHLTLENLPPILKGKLKGGFPHFGIMIPARQIDNVEFHLCRYNIAKGRFILGKKKALIESPGTGKYHSGKLIPTAETKKECQDLLEANFSKNMIEVLIPQKFDLPQDTELIFYHPEDVKICSPVLSYFNLPWKINLVEKQVPYFRKVASVKNIEDFIRASMKNPNWRGNGLEFDRV